MRSPRKELRRALVRAAGMARPGWFLASKAVEIERAHIEMARELSACLYAPTAELRTARVSVPRRFRRAFGRSIEVLA